MATFANAADGGNGLQADRVNIDLNSGWRFMRGDVEGTEAPGLAARLEADGQVLCLEKKVSTCHKTGQKGYLEDMASKSAEKTSSVPEILLIGDSIREGYCKYVAESLRGRADVKWPNDNCRNSQYILTSLATWRGLVASPKVVNFNCGHWDAAHWDGDDDALTSVEEYGRNIRKIIQRIRRYWPDAKIIFATTTPMSPSGKQSRNPRTTESIIRYNAEAVKVAKSMGVEVNDLFAVLEKWPTSDYKDYAHLTEPAAKRLGEIVASRLAKVAGL